MYYVYMLKCIDESLYTGSARDVTKRIKEHFSGGVRCAKYTRSHPPKEVVAIWTCNEKSDAIKREYRIKTMTRGEKDRFCDTGQIPDKIKAKFEGIVFSRITGDDFESLLPTKG